MFDPKAPELQTMYRMNMPVSSIRTKIRQEFERHRYVAQLPTVDVLLFHSHQEFQVRIPLARELVAPGIRKGCDEAAVKLWLTHWVVVGDYELLEARDACHEILAGGGEPEADVTTQLHRRVLGGKSCSNEQCMSRRLLTRSRRDVIELNVASDCCEYGHE